jgi:hypothetical protein
MRSRLRWTRKKESMRSITVIGTLVALSVTFAVAAQAEPGMQSKLTPVAGGIGGGMIEASPTSHDVAGPGTYDVQVTANFHGLAPNTGYRVLRWVDLNPDGVCTGPAAVTFPGNPTVTTSDGGSGELHVHLSRGAPFLDGVRFDVIFRVVDLAGNTALQSDCFTGTVK